MSAPYNPPVKNEDFAFRLSLESYTNPGNFQSNPTIAAGDFKVSVDGGALSNLTTLPTVSPASSVLVLVSLSSSEMNGDVISIVCIDQTSPKEWADTVVTILTTA